MKSRFPTAFSFVVLFVPFGLTPLLGQQAPDHPQQRYSVIDLGTLGGSFSEAVGINNAGEVAGNSTPPGDDVVHPFLWRNGVMTDVGTLGGPNSVAPEASPQPNERGEVAGASDTTTPDPNAAAFCSVFTFISDGYTCAPFAWQRGAMAELPTLGGNNGIAWQINSQGQVAGIAENSTQDPSCGSPQPEGKPVLWEGDEIRQLPTVAGDLDGAAFASNDSGQFVGFTGNCISGVPFTSFHAVLWERHNQRWTATDLGTLGGTYLNLAFGINAKGQIVGQSDLPGDTAFHAFLWQKGVMTDLGTLPGDVVSWAEVINNMGQAVGTSFDSAGDTHPFIWQDGVMTDLNTLIPAGSPWLLLEALSINDRGQIVGFGQLIPSGDVHAFLATPCETSQAEGCESSTKLTASRQRVVIPETVRRFLGLRGGLRLGRSALGTFKNRALY
jgi:probable HAF family extracellular repeat protein